MNWVPFVIAGIAAVIGCAFLWWRRSVGSELALMAATAVSPAGGVANLSPGTVVEVKGTLRVREPLAGEFSRKPAAYFKSEIERTETYWERDSQGREERKTRTTTIYTNMKYGACLVQDDSGRVGIDFNGANVEAVDVVNEPTSAPDTGSGAASGIVGGILSALASSNYTYRRKESILAPDSTIFVLGEVQEGGLIGKPVAGSKSKTFVISHKSKEERTKSLTWTTRWMLLAAIIAFAVAAGAIGWAVKERQAKTSVVVPAAVTRPA